MGIDVESYRARIGTFIRRNSSNGESEKRLRTAARLKKMWIMKYCTSQVSYTSPYWNSYKGAIESDHCPLKLLQVQGQAVPVVGRRAGKVILMMVVASVVAIVRLLLVMSGDVEENPGPPGQQTKDPTFTFKNIIRALKPVVAWKTLGVELDISSTKMKEIDVNNRGQVEECKHDMIQFWMESDKSCSWERLIEALYMCDQLVLAETIKNAYCPLHAGLKDRSTAPLQGGGGGDGGGDGGSDGEGGVADTKKLYDEAMRNGYVDREIIKCLIIGAAGVGKTTLKHLLLGNEPPEKRVSTGVLENPVRAVSISMAGKSSSGSWCKVESDEELMKMIAEAIKSGKVPKENISVGSQQNDAVVEHNDDIMLPATDIESSTVRPSDVHIEPEYNAESIHSGFIEAINNSKGSESFLSTRWIHFIDSGGQPEFHDLLSLFIPNTSVVVFVFKLSESLHHKPKVEYVGSSGRIGDPCDSYLTHKEILEHSLKTFHEPSGQSPTIVVVGTHKDCEQKLEIEDLKKCLNHMKSSLVHFGSEPIALVDCLSQHGQERDDIMEGIRSSIMEAAADKIKSQKTPLAWFGLEMELKRASKPKAGILSIDECKKQADKFPFFKNNRGQFDAALQHFIEHNIFLHYPEILRDIVFCDPQVLLTEVTRIVQHHYMLKNSKTPRRGDMISFVENGYISTNILKTINKKHHSTLEPEVFVTLLSQLNIISALGNSGFYLMPALLSNTKNPDQKIIPITGKKTISPLCITFDGGCAPSGLFCSLVAHLLKDWELCMIDDTPSCCFHNCVAYVYCGETIVTLMDLFTHFRIYVQIPPNDAPLKCQNIYGIVHTSIDAVHKRSKLKYVDAILCPSHPEQNHVAKWCSQYYQCTVDNTKSGPIPEEYEVWKKTLRVIAPDSIAPSEPSNSHVTISTQDEKPVLKRIHTLKIENWRGVGLELGMDYYCLDVITRDHSCDHNGQKVEMLSKWLGQDPNATYGKLAMALKAVGEAACADQLARDIGFELNSTAACSASNALPQDSVVIYPDIGGSLPQRQPKQPSEPESSRQERRKGGCKLL